MTISLLLVLVEFLYTLYTIYGQSGYSASGRMRSQITIIQIYNQHKVKIYRYTMYIWTCRREVKATRRLKCCVLQVARKKLSIWLPKKSVHTFIHGNQFLFDDFFCCWFIKNRKPFETFCLWYVFIWNKDKNHFCRY